MEAERQQVKLIKTNAAAVKIALLFLLGIISVGAVFAARWQLGNLFAEATVPTDETAQETANMAVALAPNDPLSHWLQGNVLKNTFSEDSFEKSIPHFEKAVRLSPNDYRFWIDLGRAREQIGDLPNAENAFRRATQLAPTYAYPHWNFGNFLLRNNRQPEAFAEFRKTAENHSVLRDQVFFLLWDFLGENPAQIEQIVGDAPAVRASLVMFYAGRDRANDALRQWNSLLPNEKQEFRTLGETAAHALYDKRHFRAALTLVKELAVEPEANLEKISNAGFESTINDPVKVLFDWKITQIKNLQITLDPGQRKEGKRSLSLRFSGYAEPTLQNVMQFVVTEPNTRYRLSFAVKTNELKSAGLPLLEITDTDKFKLINTSANFPEGTTDWQQKSVEFTAPANSDAVLIRVGRNFCGEGCPIVGTVWLDDFSLQKISK